MELTSRQRRRQAAEFFDKHPLCCFCGGETKATTQDHIPCRAVWDQRQWPEGYAFPACGKCNSLTRIDELIINMLSRIFPDPTTPEGYVEMARAIKGVGNNVPGLLQAMKATVRQLRDIERESVVVRQPGQALSELPVLSLRDPRIHEAVSRYAIKLGCALHYLHTSRIIPAIGHIASKWFSNVDALQGKIPDIAFEVAKNVPNLQRGNKDLSDQFSYVFAYTDDGGMSFFLARFRQAFAIAIAVSFESRESLEVDVTEHPFRHT